jgi:Flp pilus assembly pilin Flp
VTLNRIEVKTTAVAGESMKRTVKRLVQQDSGQDLIEYALLAALLGVACITGILQLTRIKEFFAAAGDALRSAI